MIERIGTVVSCQNCGREFVKTSGNVRYCSRDCLLAYTSHMRKIDITKILKQPEVSLAEEAREATSMGLTYGQLQALKWAREHPTHGRRMT